MSHVAVHIDRLVVTDLPDVREEALVPAVEAALTRVLAEPPSGAAGGHRPVAVQRCAGFDVDGLADAVARCVRDAVEGGR